MYMTADYIAARAGTHQWVLAPRLTPRLRERGYTLAIPRKRYDQWQREYTQAKLDTILELAQ